MQHFKNILVFAMLAMLGLAACSGEDDNKSEMDKAVSGAMEDARETAGEVKDATVEMGDEAAEAAREMADEAKDGAKEMMDDAKDGAEDMQDKAGEKADEMEQAARDKN